MPLTEKTQDNYREARLYYENLFCQDEYYSLPFPNIDEAARWSKIGKFLSEVALNKKSKASRKLRILDIGCGRGWLTNLASIYGDAEGVDPVPGSIRAARRMFPDLKFITGTAADLNKSMVKNKFDVVIATEVLEHIHDKNRFVEDIVKCLLNNGHVIVTTPRRELFDKWNRMVNKKQPIEQWLSETEVVKLFKRYNFVPVDHDRIYLDLAKMSLLHNICASRKIKQLLNKFQLGWIQKGMQYVASIYQIWCFKHESEN